MPEVSILKGAQYPCHKFPARGVGATFAAQHGLARSIAD